MNYVADFVWISPVIPPWLFGSSSRSRVPDLDLNLVSSNLWQFLGLLSFMTLTLLKSTGFCILSLRLGLSDVFSWWGRGYGFGGRILQRWGAFSSRHIWGAWYQHSLPLTTGELMLCCFLLFKPGPLKYPSKFLSWGCHQTSAPTSFLCHLFAYKI